MNTHTTGSAPLTATTFVRTDVTDGIHLVELHRPDRLNAVSDELYADLEPALQAVADDEQARVLLLTGAGRAFCAGADLKAHGTSERTPAERRAYVWAGQRVCRLLQTMRVPVVAAVQGHAIGAGAEIALSCDVVIVADDLQIAFPEVELGTFVGGGISQRLPLLAGPIRAAELLLLGRRLRGGELVEWGLATEAVPLERLEDRAREVAAKLAALPPHSVRPMKAALGRAGHLGLDDALVFEAETLLACMRTDEWSAGVEAFGAGREAEGGR